MSTHPPGEHAEDPRFPSGPWTGYFLDPRHPGRHGMDLDLTFAHGRIGGSGHDGVGPFTISGRFSDDGECRWTKRYSLHEVAYRGFREGKGIWGTWEVLELGRRVRGGFQIWPTGRGERTGVAIEEQAPAPGALVPGVRGERQDRAVARPGAARA